MHTLKNKICNLLKHKFSINKKTILLIAFFISWLLPAKTNAQTYPCLEYVLNISTGVNHMTGNLCVGNEKDQYWAITMAPTNFTPYTLPVCATSWGVVPNPMGGLSTPISIVDSWLFSDANIKVSCNDYSIPYRFVRKFKIDTVTTGNILIKYQVNDYVQNCYLVDPLNNTTNFTSLACPNTVFPYQSVTIPVNFIPGVYTLVFDVANLYISALGVNNPTHMTFELEGFVQTALPAIVDNRHFGRNTTDPVTGHINYCSAPYPPDAYFELQGRHCIKNALDTAQIWIVPFNNNAGENTYTVMGPAGAVPIDTATGMFVASAGSYTVTSTDVWGCAYDSVMKLYFSPHFNATPPSQCIAPGTQDTVVFHTDSAIVNYGFEINGAPPVGFLDSNILFDMGVYHVVCVFPDSGYCTASDTFKVGEIPTLAVSATPPCINPAGSSLIWAMASPVFSPARYDYKIYEPGNTLLFSDIATYIQANTNPGVAGIYTVYVTDTLYGCADTATIEVYTIPEPDLVLTTSKGCLFPYPNNNTAIITATPTVAGTYLYQLNGGTPQVSNLFTVSDTGTYYVNVVTPNGCASVSEKISIGNCLNCNYSGGNIYQSMQWFTNDTSSVDMGSVSPTNPIVIDGTLTVDSNLNIWNNPNVYFTPWAKIEMVSNGTPILLDIKNATLKACKNYWSGVIADNTNENIDIDSSTLTQMTWQQSGLWYSGGVNMSNGALLNATNSNFTNNHIGIVIKDVPFAYGAVIKHNRFIKDNSYAQGFIGISIWNVKDMEVGGLANTNEGNRFDTLVQGIEIFHNNSYNSSVRLYNNNFTNIKCLSYSVLPIQNDSAILSSYNYGLGCAILASAKFSNLTVDVDNLIADPLVRIIHCDAGIVSNNVNMNIANSDIENTLLAIMSKSTGNVNYKVHDNIINKSYIGISQYGNIASTLISNNRIYTRDTQTVGSYTAGITYKSPIGIDINHALYDYQPNGGFYNEISYNTVIVKTKAGIGIRNLNSDKHALILENDINLPNIDTTAVPASSDISAVYGIWNENAKKSKLEGNYIYGHPDVTGFKSRNRQGIYMNQSPSNILTCNKAKYTRYGFYAFGDNTTAKENVTYNKFNANAYPWFFLDNGSASPGTFGNVGDGLTDNGNEFISVSNPMNWLNTGGINPNLYKVFRNSFSQPGYQIFTAPTILTPFESGTSMLGNQYLVQPAANGYTDPCSDPLFIMGGGNDNNGGIDENELEKATAIAQDSVEYINYPEVGKWIDQYRLYENLNADSLLLNSTPDMLYFYNQQQSSTIGSIKDADSKISALADSSTNANNYEARYTDALNSNSSISGEEWEMNEKYVNTLKLKIMNGATDTIGYDTVYIDSMQYITLPVTSVITAEEKDFLRTLAGTCPFIGGNAVYKARTLWALFMPGQIYDDRLLCIQGQNKNADYNNINIDSLYESQIVENYQNGNTGIGSQQFKHKALEQGGVMVYPNPASTQITIEYECKTNGEFILYNSIGQEVMRTHLKKDNKRVSLLTNGLGEGVFTYKCIFAGCESMNGKLTILK